MATDGVLCCSIHVAVAVVAVDAVDVDGNVVHVALDDDVVDVVVDVDSVDVDDVDMLTCTLQNTQKPAKSTANLGTSGQV